MVGIHVRRTDKLIREAEYHSLHEYMKRAEEWFQIQERRFHTSIPRKIYIATDETAVINEALEQYSDFYQIIIE